MFISFKRQLTITFVYLGLIVFVLFSIFPVFWLMSCSIRPLLDLMMVPPKIFSSEFSLEFYKNVLIRTSFLKLMSNSLLVALVSTFISVSFAAMCAYSISRMKFRGMNIASRGILIAYMFPQVVLIVPLFVGLNRLGLADTRLGLILTHITFSFPFAMWLLVSFFKTIPIEIEEAAKVDGASNFFVFRMIILPLALPGIATSAIFCFNLSWREFLYAFVIISRDNLKTLPVGLYGFIGGEYVKWGELMAASTLIAIPTMVFFLLIQRYFISGLMAGAVKG